jgi:Fe-S cluster assembly protein SufB
MGTKSAPCSYVEIIAEKNAEVKIFDGPELVSGDRDGKGGSSTLLQNEGICRGENSKISWTQVETGSQ